MQKVTGELTTEKILRAWVSAEVNDTFCQALFENIKCAWERADAKNTSSPGTFYGHFESAWDSADVKKFFCQAILLMIFKAPGIVWMQQTLFFQALFYGNIESTWDSADATNPSFPGTSYGKSAGENAEAENTFLSGIL